MSSGKHIKLVLVLAAALFLTCRDTPRDNPFDPDGEILIVEVNSPAAGSSFTTGHPISFEVSARTGFDNEPATGSYLWKSDISGVLSEQRTFKTSLPAGRHKISVTVTDNSGRSGTGSVLLNIRTADQFGVELVLPSADTAFIRGTSFVPLAAEYVPEGTTVIGRLWNFGAGSGIAPSTQKDPGFILFNQAGIFELTYQIVDSQGRVAADTVSVEVVASATPPLAEILSPAADTSISVGDSVYLQASATQTGGRLVYIGWNYPSGSGLENRGDTVETPGWVRIDTPGVHRLRFVVTDLLGVSGEDTVVVTVNDTLDPPVSRIVQPAGDTSVVAGDSIYFSGQYTPATLTGISHTWSWDSAGPSIDSIAEPGWQVFPDTGSFVITYAARDLSERGAPDSVTVTVAGNQPPLAAILSPNGDISIGIDSDLTFEANDTDPEGRIVTRFWLWDTLSGIDPSAADSAKVAGVRTFNTTGIFTVSYHAIDHQGLEAADTVTVTVTNNQAPLAQIAAPSTDTTVYAWAPVAFAGTDSDADGVVVSRQWSFGPGIDQDTTANPGEIQFTAAGNYEVIYSVMDDINTRGADTLNLTVQANNRPQAIVFSPAGSLVISAGDSLSFMATDTDSDGTVVSRVWSYGAGSGIADDTVRIPDYRTFSNAGAFEIIYKVTDNVGGVDADTVNVTVNP